MKQPFTIKSIDKIQVLWIEVDSLYQQIILVNSHSFDLCFLMLLKRKFAENLFVSCV